jgi:RNA polymerase sigma-70 factor (ECF subfamily)
MMKVVMPLYPGWYGEILMTGAEDLLVRARRGDVEAFHEIFEQNHRVVLRFLYGMVGELDVAQELTQETFMRAFRSLGTMRTEARLSTWLCGIAKNVAYNFLRSRSREVYSDSADEQSAPSKASEELSPDSQLLNAELREVIFTALAKLDADKRLVFTLKVLQQQSYEEISAATGFSVSKLKTDLHRAKQVMRRVIRPYLETSNEV